MPPATTSTLPRRASTARVPGPQSAALHSQARAKRSGGPLDRALYRCGCGHAFTASVSTTVGCPRCGQAQAW
jgi:hypothetical protein